MKKILFIILFTFILSSLVAVLMGSSRDLTFAGLLDYLSDVPRLQLPSLSDNTIGGHWVILDELRVLFNTLISVFNILKFLSISVVNLVIYISSIINYFFVGFGVRRPSKLPNVIY